MLLLQTKSIDDLSIAKGDTIYAIFKASSYIVDNTTGAVYLILGNKPSITKEIIFGIFFDYEC